MKLKCSECGKPTKEVYPLNDKNYCSDCVPKEYRRLYKGWKSEKERNEASA